MQKNPAINSWSERKDGVTIFLPALGDLSLVRPERITPTFHEVAPMYNRTISIAIIGDYERLKNILEGLESDSLPGFILSCGKSLDPDSASHADVLLFAGPGDFAAARELAKSGAVLVACLDAEDERRLFPEDMEQLDDIWMMPMPDKVLRLRVAHLLEEIGARDWGIFLMGCLDTFMNSMRDMVWFKNLGGIHTKVNDYFCEFVGKPREEVEGSTHEDIWGAPETGEEASCHETDRAAIDSDQTVTAEEVVETDSGKRLFKTTKTPVHGLEGEILGTVGIAHDMTNMLNLNMELNLFLEMMPLPMMMCDVDDRITRANSRFQEFFETGMARLLEVDWRSWYEENILHEISPTGEDIYMRFLHDDGRISFLKMISHEMNDAFGNYLGVIHVFEDVTADKELEYNIWKLANTDALTGIANRQAFYEHAKRIHADETVNLFYIDLDNFKQVNDVFGHKAGDEALKATVAIMRDVFARDFPARLGGDEFIVCIRRDVSRQDIEEMAESLVSQMKEKFASTEAFHRLSCSVGIAADCSLAEGMEPLLKKADAAMYEAKKAGKSCYRFYRGD